MAQPAHEAHKQAVKQAQKDRVRTFRAKVDQAMADGDQHVAFKTLQLLRPWQPARRAQLRCGRPKQTHPIHQTLDRAISHLREARHLISQARPSRHERHQGIPCLIYPEGSPLLWSPAKKSSTCWRNRGRKRSQFGWYKLPTIIRATESSPPPAWRQRRASSRRAIYPQHSFPF